MTTTQEKPQTSQKSALKEYVYEFRLLERKGDLNLNSKSKIFLVINDNETNIPIESMFMGRPSIDDEDITGYSVLQMLSDGKKLKIDNNTVLNITFVDRTSGSRFYVSNIRRPFCYDDDIYITAEKRLEYVDLLTSSSAAAVPVKAPSYAKASEGEEEKSSFAKASSFGKPTEDKSEDRPKVLGGEDWEFQRKELTDMGFTEYESGDYRFFYKKPTEENPAELDFFVLEPGDYFNVSLFTEDEKDITEEKETYLFEDEKEKEWYLVFDKKSDKISIEEKKA